MFLRVYFRTILNEYLLNQSVIILAEMQKMRHSFQLYILASVYITRDQCECHFKSFLLTGVLILRIISSSEKRS